MARMALTAKARQLWRRRDGIATLEFALVLPVLLTMIMGIIEVSMILFVSALLEGGLRDASRFAITGSVPVGSTREQTIVDIVNDRSLNLFSLTTSNVRMRYYDSFENVGQPEPLVTDVNANGQCDAGDTYSDVNNNSTWDADMAQTGAGGSSSIVVYDVTVDWTLLTGFMASMLGADGKMPIAASIAVRNEPYAPSAPGAVTPSPTVRSCS